MFTQDYLLQALFVKGEVGSCKYHASGHIYFTLKDSGGTINCILFAGNRKGLDFKLSPGQQVVAGGCVDVYARDGKYQFYARQIVLAGAGILHEKFEQLKKELEEMGMFDPQYKRKIPRYIQTLGVVTADTGAAIRDIIQITRRRNPFVQILLYPALVQGDAAADSIVEGIHALEERGVDVMIVGRGGGSAEDLQAFNDRKVAEAVFNCSVPIISAVGHEIDTTIIDYVADLRAPTPSAAAELAVFDFFQFEDTLREYRAALNRDMQRNLRFFTEKIQYYKMRLSYLNPESRVREKKTLLLAQEERLQEDMRRILERYRHLLSLYAERMNGLSPLRKLSSGYAYIEKETGKNISSVRDVSVGEKLTVYLKDGRIRVAVEEVPEG